MVFARIRKGGKWEDIRPKVYSGGKWVDAHTRVRVNEQWVDLEEPKSETKPAYVPQKRVATWGATWTGGYWSANIGNRLKYNTAKWGPVWLSQGVYSPDHDQFDRGIESGMVGFDDGNIRATLGGAKIVKVELYLHLKHCWYSNGTTAVIGVHNARGGRPSTWWETSHGVARARYYGIESGQWITLPNWVGNDLRDNKITGITTHADNYDHWQYAIFYGTNAWNIRPQLRITYEK